MKVLEEEKGPQSGPFSVFCAVSWQTTNRKQRKWRQWTRKWAGPKRIQVENSTIRPFAVGEKSLPALVAVECHRRHLPSHQTSIVVLCYHLCRQSCTWPVPSGESGTRTPSAAPTPESRPRSEKVIAVDHHPAVKSTIHWSVTAERCDRRQPAGQPEVIPSKPRMSP